MRVDLARRGRSLGRKQRAGEERERERGSEEGVSVNVECLAMERRHCVAREVFLELRKHDVDIERHKFARQFC